MLGRFGVLAGEVSAAVHLGPLPRAVVVTQLVAQFGWADTVLAVVVDLNHRGSRSAISSTASPVPRWAGPGALCARLGRLPVPTLHSGGRCPVLHGARTVPKAGRPARRCPTLGVQGPLHPVHGIVNGMHRAPRSLDRLRCHRALHTTDGMHRTERGTNKRLKKPMNDRSAAATRTLQTTRLTDLFVPNADAGYNGRPPEAVRAGLGAVGCRPVRADAGRGDAFLLPPRALDLAHAGAGQVERERSSLTERTRAPIADPRLHSSRPVMRRGLTHEPERSPNWNHASGQPHQRIEHHFLRGGSCRERGMRHRRLSRLSSPKIQPACDPLVEKRYHPSCRSGYASLQ